MLQLFRDARGRLRLEVVPPPTVGAGTLLLDVSASLVAPGGTAASSAGRARTAARLARAVTSFVERWREAGLVCAAQHLRSKWAELAPLGWSVAGTVASAEDPTGIGRKAVGFGAGVALHAERVRLPADRVILLPDGFDLVPAPLIPPLAACLVGEAASARRRGGVWGGLARLVGAAGLATDGPESGAREPSVGAGRLIPGASATTRALAAATELLRRLPEAELRRLAPPIAIADERAWRAAFAEGRDFTLLWSPPPSEASRRPVVIRRQNRLGAVRVGVVGCGVFAKLHHLPNLHRLAQCEIHAIATDSPGNALQTARQYGAAYCTTDYRELVADSDIDLLLVLTRHNLHVPMILDAVKAGKSVFVEKPVATDWAGLDALSSLPPDARVTVGFNRRFAPLAAAVGRWLRDRRGPAMIAYSVNFGPSAAAWLSDPREGGGRLIGAACHYVDLATWLLGRVPVRVSADMVRSDAPGVVSDDNFVANVGYDDGSLATIWFSSLGVRGPFPRERMECFFDGRIVVVEDFQRLRGSVGRQTLTRPDFGERAEMMAVLDCEQRRLPPPVPLRDGILATAVTLKILETLRSTPGRYVPIGEPT